MICCAPTAFETLVDEDSTAVVISDYTTDWEGDSAWTQAYEMFDLPAPTERVKLLRGRRLKYFPYFNGGFVAFNERARDGTAQFAQSWLETASRFDWDAKMEFTRANVDQIALPIAIAKAGLRMQIISPDFNYNIMRRQPEPPQTHHILHYHGFKFLWQWPYGQNAYDICRSVVCSVFSKKNIAFPRRC